MQEQFCVPFPFSPCIMITISFRPPKLTGVCCDYQQRGKSSLFPFFFSTFDLLYLFLSRSTKSAVCWLISFDAGSCRSLFFSSPIIRIRSPIRTRFLFKVIQIRKRWHSDNIPQYLSQIGEKKEMHVELWENIKCALTYYRPLNLSFIDRQPLLCVTWGNECLQSSCPFIS